jgi:phytoene dehydrogenase-like protein
MNYADMVLGTWYPMGGMYKLVEGMMLLAREHGVEFRFNSAVSASGNERHQSQRALVVGKNFINRIMSWLVLIITM